jgi:hypothetical protein
VARVLVLVVVVMLCCVLLATGERVKESVVIEKTILRKVLAT